MSHALTINMKKQEEHDARRPEEAVPFPPVGRAEQYEAAANTARPMAVAARLFLALE